MQWQEMWRFETPNFAVVAEITPDDDFECDWADAETLEGISSGRYTVFGTRVRVLKNGKAIGEASLWGSVYARPEGFFSEHRDSDALNRNSSLMRAAKGENVVICHYFPSMVAQAIADARKTLG